jgi:hypothetical protein
MGRRPAATFVGQARLSASVKLRAASDPYFKSAFVLIARKEIELARDAARLVFSRHEAVLGRNWFASV